MLLSIGGMFLSLSVSLFKAVEPIKSVMHCIFSKSCLLTFQTYLDI